MEKKRKDFDLAWFRGRYTLSSVCTAEGVFISD
jgi:hypothetical protein